MHTRARARARRERGGFATGSRCEPVSLGQGGHTRQTITPHRRHSPTMSLAHLPARPLWGRAVVVAVAELPLPPAALPSRAGRLCGIACPGRGSVSFEQRSVSLTSSRRYSSRLARNWRHDRASASSELRSSCEASCDTMLSACCVSLVHPRLGEGELLFLSGGSSGSSGEGVRIAA